MAEGINMMSRLAAFCGLLGAAWIVCGTLIGAALYPGYDHGGQFISELGAIDAPFGRAFSLFGFLPAGVLLCAFAIFAWRASPKSTLATLGFIGVFLFYFGYVGAGFFQCDARCRPDIPSASQMMHNLSGLLGYFLAPVTLALLGLATRKWPGARLLSLLGFVGAIVALLALALFSPSFAFVGLVQRVLEASMLLWVLAFSVRALSLKQ
jgi:Protein of unknown function (DUF998)